MDSKKEAYINAGGNGTVVDLKRYKKGLAGAVKKPRKKKAPVMEILCCPACGGTEFRFVKRSDIAAHSNTVLCADCSAPQENTTLEVILEMLGRKP